MIESVNDFYFYPEIVSSINKKMFLLSCRRSFVFVKKKFEVSILTMFLFRNFHKDCK